MLLWTYQTRRSLLYPSGDRALKQAASSASTWFTHSTACKSSVLAQQWRALRDTEVGVSLWGSPHCSPVPGTAARLCSSSVLAGTQCHTGGRAGSKANALAQFAGSYPSRGVEKHPSPCAPGWSQQTGNLGEHPRRNKGRINVIFITDTLAWLEKVFTVQEAFSVFSQFSITEGINPKANQPLLTKTLLTLFILLPCCSLWSFSLLACFS